MSHRQGRRPTRRLIKPPHIPYAPALAGAGLPLSRLVWIELASDEDAQWAAEQILREGIAGAALLWTEATADLPLRRQRALSLRQAPRRTGPAMLYLCLSLPGEIRGSRSLENGLKELERFVRNGEHLQTGRPFQQLGGMRSREALASWLLCAVMSHVEERQFGFTSDPLGGDDGIISTDDTWRTEHVTVTNPPQGIAKPLKELPLDQIRPNMPRAA